MWAFQFLFSKRVVKNQNTLKYFIENKIFEKKYTGKIIPWAYPIQMDVKVITPEGIGKNSSAKHFQSKINIFVNNMTKLVPYLWDLKVRIHFSERLKTHKKRY